MHVCTGFWLPGMSPPYYNALITSTPFLRITSLARDIEIHMTSHTSSNSRWAHPYLVISSRKCQFFWLDSAILHMVFPIALEVSNQTDNDRKEFQVPSSDNRALSCVIICSAATRICYLNRFNLLALLVLFITGSQLVVMSSTRMLS